MKRQTKPKREKSEVGNRKSSRQITELKRNEEALLASELKYRRLFESAKDGILILDYETGVIVDVNPFLIQLLGSKKEELLGKKIWELGFFKDIAASQANFLELQQKDYIRYENLALESTDGRRRNVEFISNVYLVNSHKVIQCNVRDITERKQVEDELRQSEEKFRNLFNNSEVGMFRTRLDGSEILEFNEKYLKILGYTIDEVKGKPSVDIWADKQERDRMVQLLKAEGRVTDFECGILNKQGEVRRCITSLRLYRATGILEGSIQDITERKRMEEALVKEQNEMQIIMNYLPVKIYFKDLASRFIRISKSQTRLFGLGDPEQAIGKTDFDFFTTEHAQQAFEDEQAIIRTGQPLIKEEKETWADHPDTWVSTIKMPMRDNEGNIIGTFGLSTDITDHKQMEETLAQERNLLHTLIDNLPDHIYAKDAEGQFTLANIAVARHMRAAKPDELIGKTDFDFYPPDLARQFHADEQALIQSGESLLDHEEFTRDQADQRKWVLSTKVLLYDSQGNYTGLVGIGRDITERKQAEEALAQERNLLRSLIDNVPDRVYVKDTQSRFILSNPALARLIGAAAPNELLGKTDFDFFPQELAAKYYADEQAIFQSGQPVLELEEPSVDAAGNERWVSSTKILLRDAQGKIVGLVGMGHDITERKQAEERLRQSENFLRQVIDLVPYFIFAKDKESRFLLTNKANADAYGTTTTDIVGKSDTDFSATPEQAHHFHEDDLAVIEGGEPKFIPDEIFEDIHGNIRYLQTTKIPFQFGPAKVPALFGVAVDITERKQAEEAIRHHVVELEMLYESGLVLGQLLSPKEIARKLIDLMSAKLDWRHILIRLYHPEDETLELLAFSLPTAVSTVEYRTTEERFKAMITKAGDGLTGWAVQHRQVVRVGELAHDSRYVETEPGLHSGMYIPLKAGERVVGVISIESEKPDAFSAANEHFVVTLANQATVALENSRLHEESFHQVKRLEALHAIDQNIAGSFDQRSTLEVLLKHTLDQLGADAAVIFLLQPYQRALQYTVGKGFRTHIIETVSLKLGESLAGQAVTERRMIHINDQEAREPNSALAKLWLEEGFKCMEAVSLISKGQVKGLLSVYHRKAFTPDPTWSSFLETLAGQAAIAIESTQLFNGLQKANMELAVAYDATIEGWSRAMDLRDKETEGHTERVTEMSMQLGKAMQLGEEYLVHLRRGALLHDIGKLGVPDAILLKAEKLTDDEWQIMKKHPQFAYDMLYSVAYLRRALDIPYCHHEKWDGTGYPRALKVEQIPLAARIFAIVDVWDALTSDRPYRKAWSQPDVLKYIREQSGKHFDPQIVDIFLKEFEPE